jgi:hypothetical protein
MEKVAKLKSLMREIRKEIESDKNAEGVIAYYKDSIGAELCRFAKMMIPNIHQKIDEIIELDDMKNLDTACTTSVSAKQHGADLVNIETDSSFEIKATTITKKSPKCNISWNIPSGTNDDPERTTLLESIKEKTKNGYAKYLIKDGVGRLIKSYQFSSEFLVEYFAHVAITPKTTKVNFGCKQCSKCCSFHRLDRMIENEKLFYSQEKSLTKPQWITLFKKQSSEC